MDNTEDIREALADDLRRMGLMGPEPEAAADMDVDQARKAAWGAYGMTPPEAKPSRRLDRTPETPADTRFFDLRESGYRGWIDQDGYAVDGPPEWPTPGSVTEMEA